MKRARASSTGPAVALGLGAVLVVVSAAIGLRSPRAFFAGWLVALLFWTGTSLGSLALVMLHHLSGGSWGVLVRRPLEASARVLPLMAVAFVPLVWGLDLLFVWAEPGAEADPTLRHKQAYLNAPLFVLRAAVYFAAWIALTMAITRESRLQDEQWTASRARRLRHLAAAGLIVYAVTMTFAATDWVMSLEPHWYSSILGVLMMGGQGVSATVLAILALAWVRADPDVADLVVADRFHDLGKLLLAFVALWAYFAFSQYLIIWSANLPEETVWYLQRRDPVWQGVAVALALFHFAVPVALLLSRSAKRQVRSLVAIAVALAVMRIVDVIWLVLPSIERLDANAIWTTASAVLGTGGLWVAWFLWRLGERPLVPVGDPDVDVAYRAAVEARAHAEATA